MAARKNLVFPLLKPQTPIKRYKPEFATSTYTLDDFASSRSHSRARPSRGLPDLTIEPRSDRQSRLRHHSRSFSPGHQTPRSDRDKARFLSPSLGHGSLQQVPNKTDSTLNSDLSDRDVRGQEMSENSRVWNVYMNEATKFDTSLIDGWNRSLDVLLVFTGLFSAVLTTFIVQTYSQMLLPNPTDLTNALLAELMLLQFNTTPSGILALKQRYGSAPLTGQARWVNGCFFTALAFSLSSALVSMLAKQWSQGYLPNASGSLRTRARMRQLRLMRLEDWHVLTIVNLLPLLLHTSLLLFFAGLILLLWSTDLGITLATLLIVIFAYAFYFLSIWLPIMFPDCPYHHPIAEQIQRWSPSTSSLSLNTSESMRNIKSEIDREHAVDALALCWLITKCADNNVNTVALQAISGLPRNFSAMHLLRNEGALALVEQGFESCFHKDTDVDMEWHLIDVEGAELFCRSWMHLTWGTSQKWPMELVEPLWKLSDQKQSFPDAAAYAACAVALSSFDTLSAQWELLAFLARHVNDEISLSQVTIAWILESLDLCLTEWVMPHAVIGQTKIKAIPILLQLLGLKTSGPDDSSAALRRSIILTLFIFTHGPVDLSLYRTEEQRRESYCEMALRGFSAVLESPTSHGVNDDLLDLTAQELSSLSKFVVAQSERSSQAVRALLRSNLTTLFVSGRLSSQAFVSNAVLANVLQLLFPPTEIPVSRRPVFVSVLVDTLDKTSDADVSNWAVRLLEDLLTRCQMPISQAFAENKGLHAVLRAAKAGNVDSRRLQIDSIRALCAFIHSSTSLYTQSNYFQGHPDIDRHFDAIFQSDFFEILCSVVASRRWWLFEVSGHWMPALLSLCRIRPREEVWKVVVDTFQKFAERNEREEGCVETLLQLDEMREVILRTDSGGRD